MDPAPENTFWDEQRRRGRIRELDSSFGEIDDPFLRTVEGYYAALALQGYLMGQLAHSDDEDDTVIDRTLDQIVCLQPPIIDTFDALVDQVLRQTTDTDEQVTLLAGLFSVADRSLTPMVAQIAGRDEIPKNVFDPLKELIRKNMASIATQRAFTDDLKNNFARYSKGIMDEVKYLYDYEDPAD